MWWQFSYAENMPNSQSEEMKEAVYEYASFLYDLYMDSLDDGIIESGQNNATQFDIN